MFEIKKESVEITDKAGNKDVYEIGPLPGAYLEDLYSVIEAFQKANGDNDEILKVLGDGAASKLHKLVFASLKGSYPEQKDEILNQFVTQNLMKFIEPIMKINIPQE